MSKKIDFNSLTPMQLAVLDEMSFIPKDFDPSTIGEKEYNLYFREQEEKPTESHVFRNLFIASPLLTGAGITSYKLYKELEEPVSKVENLINPQYSASKTALEQFMNEHKFYSIAPEINEKSLKLRKIASNIELDRDQVYNTIIKAAKRSDPTGQIADILEERLSSAATSQDLLKDLSLIVPKNSSLYMNKVYSDVVKDISLLNDRKIAGQLSEFRAIRSTTQLPTSVSLNRINPAVAENIKEMASKLGANFKILKYARDDLPGEELKAIFSGGKLSGSGTLEIALPTPLPGNEGVVIRGASQQTQYITGKFALVKEGKAPEILNYQEWIAQRANKNLTSKILNTKELNYFKLSELSSEFELSMRKSGQQVPFALPGEHAGVEKYLDIRSNILQVFKEEGEDIVPLTELEQSRLIKSGGIELPTGEKVKVFPGFSPNQIVKGKMSLIDTREVKSLIPEAATHGKRPIQHLTPEFEPMFPEEIKNWELNKRFSWLVDDTAVDTPVRKILMVSPDLDVKLQGLGVSAEGGSLVTESINKLRRQRKIRHLHVSADEVLDLFNYIDVKQNASGEYTADVNFWKVNKPVKVGQTLGRDPVTGELVTIDKDAEILHIAKRGDPGKGNFFDIAIKEEVGEEELRFGKGFGAQKTMETEISGKQMRKTVSKVFERTGIDETLSRNIMFGDVHSIMSGAELKKARGLHYDQMLSSLWAFTKTNIEKNITTSEKAKLFVRDPLKTIQAIRDVSVANDIFSHEEALSRIVGLAREAKLTPEQMGGVFGLVPHVFGGIEDLGPLSIEEEKAIKSGLAINYAQEFYKGSGGYGAGARATIEPRAFELMKTMPFGKELQEEISKRIIVDNPNIIYEQEELTKSLRSLLDLGKTDQPVSSIEDVMTGIRTSEGLPFDPVRMRIGDIGDVYIPGNRDIRRLMSMKTAEGFKIESPLSRRYKSLIFSVEQFSLGNMTEEAMRAEIEAARNEVAVARMGTVTGDEGILRNRVPGSRFLTAIEATPEMGLAPGEHGISPSYAREMFNDLRESGLYNAAEIEKMDEVFMAGERIPIVLGRHPYIGQHSTQYAWAKKIDVDDSVMAINEKKVQGIVYSGNKVSSGEMANLSKLVLAENNASIANFAPTNEELLKSAGGELVDNIRFGAGVGLSQDFDADIVSAMFAGPQLSEKIEQQLAPSKMKAYEDFAIRMQVMKAKAASANATMIETAAGDLIKLSVAKGGKLGQISNQLQQYKAAVLSGAGGLNAEEIGNSLSLLEWLEQTPISGKHIPTGQEERMLGLLEDLQFSLQQKSRRGISGITRDIMSTAKESGQAALREGFTFQRLDKSGNLVTRNIKGIDLENTVSKMVTAVSEYDRKVKGNVSLGLMRKFQMGKKVNITEDLIRASLDEDVLKKSTFGEYFTESARSTQPKPIIAPEVPKSRLSRLKSKIPYLDDISSRAGQAFKQLSENSSVIKKLAKPLGIGLAATAGLSMFLNTPDFKKKDIRNAEVNIPKSPPVKAEQAEPNFESGSGGKNRGFGGDENIAQTRTVEGEPTAQNLVQSEHKVRLRQNSPKYKINVSGRSNSSVNVNAFDSQMRRTMRGRTTSNSNIRDNRMSLTPQKLSVILESE